MARKHRPALAWDDLEIYDLIGMYGGRPASELTAYFLRTCDDLWNKASKLGITNYNAYDYITLTDNQRSLIFASLLGNATIYRGKTGRQFATIEFTHGARELPYLQYKHAILENLAQPNGIQHRTRQQYTYHRFITRYLACLNDIYAVICRDGGNRCVTKEWLAELSHPSALAVWFMDVGDIQPLYRSKIERAQKISRGHNLRLYLHVKTRNEAVIIHKWLEREWGIEMNLHTIQYSHTKNEHYVLQRAVAGVVHEFIALIEPYVIQPMQYKIDLV
jgi:hypothetical protein